MPSRHVRLLAAMCVAVAAAMVAWFKSRHGALYDFPHYTMGGRALLGGIDPYPSFVYPLPAAMWGAVFAPFPTELGGALFVGSAFGFLAFGLTRDGWHRLPILISGPATWCLHSGQWTPLVVAAAMTPAFAWAAVAKPTIGLAAFAYRPSWHFAWVGGATLGLSLLVMPNWPLQWWAATQTANGVRLWAIPVLQPFGLLLALAVLRWRTPEGRLILAMSCVPQSMLIYDQFPLLLTARTRLESIIFSLYTQIVPIGVAYLTMPDNLSARNGTAQTFPFWARSLTFTMYLPALVIVLRRPNEGAIPSWLERVTVNWPRWLRGAAPVPAQ